MGSVENLVLILQIHIEIIRLRQDDKGKCADVSSIIIPRLQMQKTTFFRCG